MRIAAVQMNPGADKAANIVQMRQLARAAIQAERPDLIAFPEVWTCLGGDRATKVEAAEPLPDEGSGASGGEA
jgi:predicted amidohydrolase